MADIFGAIGSIIGGSMQASAIRDATEMQIEALQRQRDFVFSQLEPSRVNRQALQADINRAQSQLALQGVTDPAALATRYAAEDKILQQVLGLGSGPADEVAQVAASEAIAGTPGMNEAKNALVDAALKELRLGATLPPDVQAELVQAGLERSGETVGAATGSRGTSGQILRQVLGSAGIQLQQQRQQQASAMLDAASNLEGRRQQILGTLFPNLSSMQLNTLTGTQNALQQSANMVPQAGLSGGDVAKLWLARVGATNQLASQSADIGMTGALNQAGAWNSAIGGATRALAPYVGSAWNSLTSPSTSSNVASALAFA